MNVHATKHTHGAGVERFAVGILNSVAATGVLNIEKQIARFGYVGAGDFRTERDRCQACQARGHQSTANTIIPVLAIEAVLAISTRLTIGAVLAVYAILSISAVLPIGTGFSLGAPFAGRTLFTVVAATGGKSGCHGDQGQQLSFFTQLEYHCVAPVIYGVVFEYGARSLSLGKVMLWRTHKR